MWQATLCMTCVCLVVPVLYLVYWSKYGDDWGEGMKKSKCDPDFPTWMLVMGIINLAMPFVAMGMNVRRLKKAAAPPFIALQVHFSSLPVHYPSSSPPLPPLSNRLLVLGFVGV